MPRRGPGSGSPASLPIVDTSVPIIGASDWAASATDPRVDPPSPVLTSGSLVAPPVPVALVAPPVPVVPVVLAALPELPAPPDPVAPVVVMGLDGMPPPELALP